MIYLCCLYQVIITFVVGSEVHREIHNDFSASGEPFLMGTVALGKAFCFYRQWIYCVCPAMLENPKQLPNFTEKIRNKNCSYQGCPLSCPCLYCYHFLPFPRHKSGTRKVLLGPWLLVNNTEVYPTLLLVLIITQL